MEKFAISHQEERKPMSESVQPSPLYLLVQFRAKPGQEARLRETLLNLVTPSRAEAGCVAYDVFEVPGDPAAVNLVECWVSEAALDFHFQTPHFLAADKLFPEMIEGTVQQSVKKMKALRPAGR